MLQASANEMPLRVASSDSAREWRKHINCRCSSDLRLEFIFLPRENREDSDWWFFLRRCWWRISVISIFSLFFSFLQKKLENARRMKSFKIYTHTHPRNLLRLVAVGIAQTNTSRAHLCTHVRDFTKGFFSSFFLNREKISLTRLHTWKTNLKSQEESA